MFQSALIRPHGEGAKIVDAGTVAETLLFYGKVHVAADYGLLTDMLKTIGPNRFLQLIRDGLLSVSYSNFRNGIMNNTSGYVSKYTFTSIKISKHASGKRVSAKTEIKDIVYSVTGSSGRRSKKLAENLTEVLSIKGGFVDGADMSSSIAHQELDDNKLLKSSVATVISHYVPSYKLPKVWEFRPIYGNYNELYIDTDLDFQKLNDLFRTAPNFDGHIIKPELFLLSLLEARMDAELAADYMAELVTKSTNSDLIRLKMNGILRRRAKSEESLSLFQEVIFDNAKAIREAINSGERSFDDFMPILEKASKFKDWIARQSPDASLIHNYHDALTSDSWISGLPGKSLRYVLAAGIGSLNPVAGLAISAADQFLVEKLMSGWRPSQFVNGPLKGFLNVD
jgi:hypothetical protein